MDPAPQLSRRAQSREAILRLDQILNLDRPDLAQIVHEGFRALSPKNHPCEKLVARGPELVRSAADLILPNVEKLESVLAARVFSSMTSAGYYHWKLFPRLLDQAAKNLPTLDSDLLCPFMVSVGSTAIAHTGLLHALLNELRTRPAELGLAVASRGAWCAVISAPAFVQPFWEECLKLGGDMKDVTDRDARFLWQTFLGSSPDLKLDPPRLAELRVDRPKRDPPIAEQRVEFALARIRSTRPDLSYIAGPAINSYQPDFLVVDNGGACLIEVVGPSGHYLIDETGMKLDRGNDALMRRILRDHEGLEVVEVFNEELSGDVAADARLVAERIQYYISPPLAEPTVMWRTRSVQWSPDPRWTLI